MAHNPTRHSEPRCKDCNGVQKFDIDGTLRNVWCPRCNPRDPFEHAAAFIQGVLP